MLRSLLRLKKSVIEAVNGVDAPINREYEERLYDYYGRPKYWDQPSATIESKTRDTMKRNVS